MAVEIYYRVRTSADQLTCWLEPTESTVGTVSDLAALEEFLKEAGIVYGLDRAAMEMAFQLEVGEPAAEVTIARGEPPHHGENGRVEWKIDLDPKPKFVPDEVEGFVDYKECVRFTTVESSEVMAIVHQPTYGRPGITINGREVAAQRGLAVALDVGEGVKNIDGKCTAQMPGRPIWDGSKLKVVSVLEIKGSLSYETGNIHYHGPVVITGDVPDGFQVRSDAEVSIGGTVGDATVFSRKKITVSGGIVGKERAQLISEGSIEVRFAHYARLEARGDILVSRDLMHTTVETLGSLKCKGKIVGGQVTTVGGIEAESAGSEAGVPTIIQIGMNYETERLVKSLRLMLDKLSKVAAPAEAYLISKSIPANALSLMNDLNNLLKVSAQKVSVLDKDVKHRLKVDQEKLIATTCKLRSYVHAGSRIESPFQVWTTKEDRPGPLLALLDPKNQELKVQ
jgi:uncharacterized protein (DUF342 family)